MATTDDYEDNDFQGGGSGASETYPMQCSALRKNGYVIIKGRPCKIVEMSTSKTGKHGHAKVHLVALDIFTGKKLEDLCPSTHNMSVPHVQRREYQLTNISDEGYLEFLCDDGSTKDDIRLPDSDLGKEISTKFDNGDILTVTTIAAMNDEAPVSVRVVTDRA